MPSKNKNKELEFVIFSQKNNELKFVIFVFLAKTGLFSPFKQENNELQFVIFLVGERTAVPFFGGAWSWMFASGMLPPSTIGVAHGWDFSLPPLWGGPFRPVWCPFAGNG